MEANSISILDLRLGLAQVGIIGILLFALGFWLAQIRVRKLVKQISKMEKKIMDLNTELLYGTAGTVDTAVKKGRPTVSRGSAS